MEFRKIPMLHNLYEISADGKCFRRVSTGKELKISESSNYGYSLIVLTVNSRYPEERILHEHPKAHLAGVRKNGTPVHQLTLKVHQLVYDAWVGEVPDGMVIDHIDRNRSNNSVDNLRAVSISENAKNSFQRVRHDRGGCLVSCPDGSSILVGSKDEAFKFISERVGKSYRTVYNFFYGGGGVYKGYSLAMDKARGDLWKNLTLDSAGSLLLKLECKFSDVLKCGIDKIKEVVFLSGDVKGVRDLISKFCKELSDVGVDYVRVREALLRLEEEKKDV